MCCTCCSLINYFINYFIIQTQLADRSNPTYNRPIYIINLTLPRLGHKMIMILLSPVLKTDRALVTRTKN